MTVEQEIRADRHRQTSREYRRRNKAKCAAKDKIYRATRKEQYTNYVRKHRNSKGHDTEHELLMIEHQKYIEKFREVCKVEVPKKTFKPLPLLMQTLFSNIGLAG